MMLLFLFIILPNLFSQSYPPEKYIQWFVKAVILLEDMGHEVMATTFAQKLPQDEVYRKMAESLGLEAKRFEAITRRDIINFHRDINKKILVEIPSKDLIYLIWLLSILQKKILEPTWAEKLNVIIQTHWKGNIPQEIEKEYSQIYNWYKKFNQGQGIVFSKKISGKNNEIAKDVIQTKDGGYVLVGDTDSAGKGRTDIMLAKHDRLGTWLWTQTFGGAAKDTASSIIETQEGDILILGTTWSTEDTRNDVWLIKTNSKGQKIWDKHYGGSRGDDGVSIVETPDKGFLILANSPSDSSIYPQPWIIRIDQEGKILQQKRIETLDENYPQKLKLLPNGDILVLGSILVQENWEIYLLKLNSNLEKNWEQRYGGKRDDRAVDLQTNEQGWAILASTNSFEAGYLSLWLLQINDDGKKISEKILGGGQFYNYPTSLVITADQSWIITGYTTSFGSDKSSSWLVKTDPKGNIIWNKNIRDGQAKVVILCNDQGFAIVGERISEQTKRDIFLMKSDKDGRSEK